MVPPLLRKYCFVSVWLGQNSHFLLSPLTNQPVFGLFLCLYFLPPPPGSLDYQFRQSNTIFYYVLCSQHNGSQFSVQSGHSCNDGAVFAVLTTSGRRAVILHLIWILLLKALIVFLRYVLDQNSSQKIRFYCLYFSCLIKLSSWVTSIRVRLQF